MNESSTHRRRGSQPDGYNCPEWCTTPAAEHADDDPGRPYHEGPKIGGGSFVAVQHGDDQPRAYLAAREGEMTGEQCRQLATDALEAQTWLVEHTPQPAATPATDPCPSWCVRRDGRHSDHSSEAGGAAWPPVVATAWPGIGLPELVPHPTWGEGDGLPPAVALWVYGGLDEHDFTIDLCPKEARMLASRLVAAAAAVESQ